MTRRRTTLGLSAGLLLGGCNGAVILGGVGAGGGGPGGADGAAGQTCDADARAVGNELSTYALEIARAADPEQAFRVGIQLRDPGSVAGLTVEEREAQLAPYQDPIVALLDERAATNIERFWLINIIYADLPAKYVPDVLCWPSVLQIASNVSYWEVVERPWDTASVGSAECPVTNGTCPVHCSQMTAKLYDPTGGCLHALGLVACSIYEVQGPLDGLCSFKSSTGELNCDFPLGVPQEPSFLGWRACTRQEMDTCGIARACL